MWVKYGNNSQYINSMNDREILIDITTVDIYNSRYRVVEGEI